MNRSETGYEPTMHPDEWEANVSALLDGELGRDSALETVDRLLTNTELQRFYREGRLLQKELDWTTEIGIASEKLPTGLWKKIEKKSQSIEGKFYFLGMPPTAFRWLAAASFILFLTVTVSKINWMQVLTHYSHLDNKGPIEIELGEGNNNMTEERFQDMTTELLRSDRRFHWKMLEILQQVTEPRPNSERIHRTEVTESALPDNANRQSTQKPESIPKKQQQL